MSQLNTIPVFNLQTHHDKVKVPAEFDIRDLSRKYHVFPLKMISQQGRKRLLLAMRNPHDQKAVLDVEFRAGVSVLPVQADDVEIQWLIQTHYYGRKLSPVPTENEMDVSHDVFQQLEMTTDSQEQPDWVRSGLEQFVVQKKEG